jgi:hypothetical protein
MLMAFGELRLPCLRHAVADADLSDRESGILMLNLSTRGNEVTPILERRIVRHASITANGRLVMVQYRRI